MYGREEARQVAAMLAVDDMPAERSDGGLPGLARWAADQVTADAV